MKQTKQSVGAAIDALSTGGSIRCNDMVRILSGLGFAVRDGSKQGHKVITHPAKASRRRLSPVVMDGTRKSNRSIRHGFGSCWNLMPTICEN